MNAGAQLLVIIIILCHSVTNGSYRVIYRCHSREGTQLPSQYPAVLHGFEPFYYTFVTATIMQVLNITL